MRRTGNRKSFTGSLINEERTGNLLKTKNNLILFSSFIFFSNKIRKETYLDEYDEEDDLDLELLELLELA